MLLAESSLDCFEAKFLGNAQVAFFVAALEVAEQALALADHAEQAASAVIVFLIFLEVLGELVNFFSKDSNLHFW